MDGIAMYILSTLRFAGTQLLDYIGKRHSNDMKKRENKRNMDQFAFQIKEAQMSTLEATHAAFDA